MENKDGITRNVFNIDASGKQQWTDKKIMPWTEMGLYPIKEFQAH